MYKLGKKEEELMWILFAFGAALFAGLTAILAKIGIKNVDSNVATATLIIIIIKTAKKTPAHPERKFLKYHHGYVILKHFNLEM